MSQQAQERIADGLGALALGSWTLNLTDINLILETVTLALGAVAALFSLFFHVRRWWRTKKANSIAEAAAKAAAEAAERKMRERLDDILPNDKTE